MTTSTRPSFVSIDQLLARKSAQPIYLNRQGPSAGPDTAFATGFHLYTQLGLNLPIAAAEDDASAARYLDILSDYAQIGEAAAHASGARLLEVQGERLHFLVEEGSHASAPNVSSWQRLLTLSSSIINMAYERLARKAGDNWNGCQAAADFGPAALLYSHIGGGSLVSLGNSANTPAKRLGQEPGVSAGHLAVPEELALRELRGSISRRWLEINLLSPSEATREFLGSDLRETMRQFIANGAQTAQPKVHQLSRDFFESLRAGTALNPTRVQGFCFRADLDGFTKQVQAAFSKGPEAVLELVRKFHALLEFPSYFESQMQGARTVILPWAGDCANILLIPNYADSFSIVRQELPVKAAIAWHKAFSGDRKFTDAVAGARWTLGMAAGDENEGNDGRMIVADLPASGRTFRVVAGWAARRSGDGYQYDGVVAGDTVITKIDRERLWSDHQSSFKDLGSIFAKATIESLQKAASERQSRASQSVASTSSILAPIPAPRPYAHE